MFPNKRAVRKWTEVELERAAQNIEGELHRRFEVETRRRVAKREAEDREVAAEQARTVVRSRYVQQSVRCGKPSCHCSQGGEAHGGYWYRIDTYGDGRRRKNYEGKDKPKGAS